MYKITSLKIAQTEYQTRLGKLRDYLEQVGSSGVVLFERDYILYYTGFAFIPTERPIGFMMNTNGDTALVVPRLEKEHAESLAVVNQVVHYIEYPHLKHPMDLVIETMQSMGIRGDFSADHDGYPWIFGYQGKGFTEILSRPGKPVAAFIESEMMVKSEAEIALITESAKWGNLAHVYLQRYTQAGKTETEVSLRASMDATLAMVDAIGPIYRAQSYFDSGASAGYRGQIGRNSAIPHALANNIVFQAGDVLVTGANAPVWGYNSELERTMFIGKPTDEQAEVFHHMLDLQDLAMNSIKPGIPCANVDRIIRNYYEEHQLMDYWKHHVGHTIGIRYHEGPYLDIGDSTTILPGMVFTVEPGLYVPGIGGFRHSDTAVVREDGVELLTFYPRDMEALII